MRNRASARKSSCSELPRGFGLIVYRLLFSLRLTPEMLAPSYTNALPFDNQKSGFAQHWGAGRLHFRHKPMTGPRVGKCRARVVEFLFRRPKLSPKKQIVSRAS